MYNYYFCLGLMTLSLVVGFIVYIKSKVKGKEEINKISARLFCHYIFVVLCYFFSIQGINTTLKERLGYIFAVLDLVAFDALLISTVEYTIFVNNHKEETSAKVVMGILYGFVAVDILFLLSNLVPSIRGWCLQFDVVPIVYRGKEIIYGFNAMRGLWYYPHYVSSYVMACVAMVTYIQKILTIPNVYRVKYTMLNTSFLLAVLFDIHLHVAKCDYYFDFSIPLISLIALYIYKLIFNDSSKLLLLTTRKMIFDRVQDPILLFDMDNRLVNWNKEAEKIFGSKNTDFHHMSLKKFIAVNLEMQISEHKTSTVEDVNLFIPPADRKKYKLEYTILKDKKGRNLGTLLVFDDISIITKRYQGLEGFNTLDEITSLPTNIMLQREMTEINLFKRFPYSAISIDISGLKLLQEGLGYNSAEDVIRFVSSVIRASFQPDDFIAYHEGTFNILTPNGEQDQLKRIIELIKTRLDSENPFDFPVKIEYGIGLKESPEDDIQNAVNDAENELYENKMLNTSSNHAVIVDNVKRILTNYDRENEDRSNRQAELCEMVGIKMVLSEDDLTKLKLLADVHDIGKVSAPDKLMFKRGPLTQEEKAILAIHATKGCQIARKTTDLQPIAREILCHHEWWNGQGYPNGYAGEEIPLLSRILSVVECYDELIHERIYHSAVTKEEALMEIERRSGEQYDPNVVNVFLEIAEAL